MDSVYLTTAEIAKELGKSVRTRRPPMPSASVTMAWPELL
jgi:hypothetical protein